MEPSEFTKNAPGRLVKIEGGHSAFVPDVLPPDLPLDAQTVAILSNADRALGELAGIGRMLPNPYLLIDPLLRREAVFSTRIEGTITTLQQVLLFEEGPSGVAEEEDAREVVNYIRALRHGLDRLKELPICLRLLREMHELLLAGVRGHDRAPGKFRRLQNAIGPPGASTGQARFVPPPVPEMKRALDGLEKFITTPTELPFLMKLAMTHYQFEAIHPFMDGNGRIGRLLIVLQLCERDILPQPLLYLSAYFERHRHVYYDHLLRVSQTGAWLQWIQFFLTGVAEQSRDAVNRSKLLLDLWQNYRSRLGRAYSSANVLRLVDILFTSPAVTNNSARKRLGVTARSAQRNIEKLEAAGILKEATGRSRNRVYVAPEIIEIVEAVD